MSMKQGFASLAGTGSIGLLEERITQHVGAAFAVALCNGTAALHAALIACDVGPGDQVVVPSYTWGGTIAALLQVGALPVFADINENLTLDPADVAAKITARTKAVIAVHLLGYPAECETLGRICSMANVALIEDCAQAYGARIGGRSVGSFGIGCFSFGAGKLISAGDGGVLTTNDREQYEKVLFRTQHPLRQLRDIRNGSAVNQFALNYRMSERTSRSILSGIDDTRTKVESRGRQYGRLIEHIRRGRLQGVFAEHPGAGVSPSWHHFSPRIDEEAFRSESMGIKKFVEAEGFRIERGYVPVPLHLDPVLKKLVPERYRELISKAILPATEAAVRTRIGIALKKD